MAFWTQYTSPLGYTNNGNSIDSYGVDHSGFSTQDEVQYQMARVDREKEMMKQMSNQGITNYPQYTTNFWGNSADNNYGFGTSNIQSNIENMQQNIASPQLTPNQQNIQPKYWESAADGKQVYDNVVSIEGDVSPKPQNWLEYNNSVINSIPNIASNYQKLKDAKLTDKYKHAFINCNAAQYGQGGADFVKNIADARELFDIITGTNSIDSSRGDQYANEIGRLLGSKYSTGDCDALVQKYIKKY